MQTIFVSTGKLDRKFFFFFFLISFDDIFKLFFCLAR